jgi:uncharacterized membrane protein
LKDHWTKHTTEADDAVAAISFGRAIATVLLNFVVFLVLAVSDNMDETIKVWVVFLALGIANILDFGWHFWLMYRNAKKRMR